MFSFMTEVQEQAFINFSISWLTPIEKRQNKMKPPRALKKLKAVKYAAR